MDKVTLPFNNMDLIIEQTPTGYDLYLASEGEKVRTLSLESSSKTIVGYPCAETKVKVYTDYYDPSVLIHHSLLTPEDKPAVIMQPDGRLFCQECHCYVPNTANYEMRKEHCFSHSHICGIRSKGEVYLDDEKI